MKAPVRALAAIVPAVAVAAIWWATSRPADDSLRREIDELRQRVAELEGLDDARATALRKTDRDIEQLEERIVEAELRDAHGKLARRASPGASAPPDGVLPVRPEDVPRRAALEEEAKKAETKKLLAGLGAVTAGLESQVAGMKLRTLPVDERWKRAMKDVGLNDNQVEVLRQAFTDRDAVYAAATEREKRQDDDGTWLVETRVDAAAVAEADHRYETAVSGVMTDEQRQRWTDLGYAGAFGLSRPSNSTWRYPAKD
jgi:hypothetical protein